MRPRTLVLARDPGAASALLPIVLSGPVDFVAVGSARQHVQRQGIACRGPSDDTAPDVPRRAITETRPQALLTGTSRQAARDAAWWEAARSARLPSIAVVDHWAHPRERFSVASAFDKLPDAIAVIDEQARYELVELGCPGEKLRVTGQPAFDVYLDAPPEGRQVARDRWGADETEWIVLFASEPVTADLGAGAPVDEKAALVETLTAARSLGARLIVRPHPREDAHVLRHALRDERGAIVDADVPRAQAIAGADVIVGISSIFLVEAALAGRHVLGLDPSATSPARRFPALIEGGSSHPDIASWLGSARTRGTLGESERRERNALAGLMPGAADRIWKELERSAASASPT